MATPAANTSAAANGCLCDNCEEPTLLLSEMPDIQVVEVAPRAPGTRQELWDQELRSAPRRPARWCETCCQRHAIWQRRARGGGRRASRRLCP